MKKILLFLSFLLMSIGIWGATKTEGFETKTTGNNYQGTVTISQAESDCSVGWTIYYGCVSTSSKINGNNSAALRLYTSNNYGYIKTTTAIDNLTNVSFRAKAATSNGALIKIDIKYSTNGSTWTNIETNKSLSTSATTYSVNIPSGGKYFQIAINSNSTKPSKNNAQLTIDDVVFTYTGSSPTTYTVTYNANGGTGTITDSNSPYSSGATVTVLSNAFTAPSGYEFNHWDTKADDSGTDYVAGNTFSITQDVTLYAQWSAVQPTPPSPIVSGKVFELLTDIDNLNDSDNIIILNSRKDNALSTVQNTHNRGVSQDYRLIMGKTVAILNNTSSVQVFRVEKTNDLWQLCDGAGYIYSAGNVSGNNYLKTQLPNDDNGKWIITLDENNYASIVSQGENTNNTLLYNSSGLFSSYSKLTPATRKIYIYKESTFSETYTITLRNQLGPDSIKVQSAIGEIVHIPSSMNICNDCYGSDWSLDGWVSSLEAYKPVYKDEFIPTKDTVLYALYSRGSLHPVEVDEYKLVTSSQENWSGDYLIAYDSHIFANGQVGGETGDGMGAQDIYFDPDENLSNDVVTVDCGDLYNITLEEVSDGSGTYLMKTKDGKYNYQTSNSNGLASTDNRSTAENYPLTITFNSSSDIDISIPAGAVFHYNTQGYFRFYKNGGQGNIYLYKKQTTTKPVATEYSTAPECDYGYISTWGTGSISIPQENLSDVTNPSYITIKNIGQNSTILNKTSLSPSNGEYNVSVSNLTNNSCDKINILVEGTDSMYMIYKVPIIVSSNVNTEASIFTSETGCATCDVVVTANNVLTAAGTTSKNRNVKVYEGGKLYIPSDATYTINSLALRRTNDIPAYLSLKGNLTLSGDSNLFLDVYTDPSDWRWMTLPEPFAVNNLKKTNGRNSVLGTDYYISTYDGHKRATERKNGWIDVESSTTFSPGEGFLFGIDGDGTVKQEYRFKFSNTALDREKADKVLSWPTLKSWGCGDETLKPNHKGWNLIGNPFMDGDTTDILDPIRIGFLEKEIVGGSWTGGWVVNEDEPLGKLRYAVIPNSDEQYAAAGYYESVVLDEKELKPFECFFIQLGGNTETLQTITMKSSKRRNMMRRMIEVEDEDDEIFLRIKVDNWKTGCFISSKFTNEFEPGDDLESMYAIYQLIDGFKYLYSAIPDSTLIEGVTVHSPGGRLMLDPRVNREEFEYVYAKRKENNVATDIDIIVPTDNNVLYDILGRRVGKDYNGVVIKDKRKFIVR